MSHLHHLSVDVEAGVTQLSDLLGQQLHPLCGVTEDDGLVDLKLWVEEKNKNKEVKDLTSTVWSIPKTKTFWTKLLRCVTLEKSVLRQ